MKRFSLLLALVTLVAIGVAAQPPDADQAKVVRPPDQKLMVFPGLPACAKGAVTRGDPSNGPSVIYASWPAGCNVPLHWHTPNEQLTIVSGSGRLSMKDGNKQTVGQGSFVYLPSKHQHSFRCTTACTFYLTSDAVFDIHYVDASGKEIPPEQALASSKTGAETKTAKQQ